MARKPGAMWVLRQFVGRYFSEGVPQAAAELSYFLLFSFCPILMFTTAVLARIDLSEYVIDTVTQFLPESIQTMIHGYIEYLSEQPRLSPLILGTVLTIYFLSRAVRSLMRKVNEIYGVHRRVGTLYQVVMSLVFTCGFLLSIIGTAARHSASCGIGSPCPRWSQMRSKAHPCRSRCALFSYLYCW